MTIISHMQIWPHGPSARRAPFPVAHRGLGLAVLLLWSIAGGAHAPAAGAAPAQLGPDAGLLTEEAARALESPIPYTEASTARGQRLYGFLGCTDCHGTDGKALIEVVANATDLTDPGVWRNGTETGLVFRSIRDGAGLAMPPFKTQVAEESELWDLVNFVRSLWPEDRRPAVVTEPR